MWLTGLVAPRHVGSFQTRARTRVPCIGRQIPNHCATREAPQPFITGVTIMVVTSFFTLFYAKYFQPTEKKGAIYNPRLEQRRGQG